jgi:amino acid adenylation domain-containing protein
MRLISRLNEAFHVEIPLVDFFRGGTIKRIAKRIREIQARGEAEKEIAGKGLVRPFDISRAPLLRAVLVKLQPEHHLLLIDMHHIITDGMSIEIFFNEFTRLYAGEELPGLKVRYKDFCQWQAAFFAGESYRKQEEYWLNCFKGEIPQLNLPLDFPRPEVKKGEGKRIETTIETGLSGKIKALAAEREVTLFMFFLAAYNILLSKYSSRQDIIIGTPVSGRTHADSDQLVGLFVNTLATRNFPRRESSFIDFLEEVKNNCLQALENQDYQLDILIDKLGISGTVNRNPLFDTIFTLNNVEIETSRTGRDELKIIPYDPGNNRALVDLSLVVAVHPGSGEIQLSFTYDTHLFKEETVRNMLAYLLKMISWVVGNPGETIGTVLDMMGRGIREAHDWDTEPGVQKSSILDDNDNWEEEIAGGAAGELSEEERRYLLYELNETQMEKPADAAVHRLFEKQVQKTPQRIALVSGEEQLSYRELEIRANRIARVLLGTGIENNRCIGVLLERSANLMAGILGILKAGACYLPLGYNDPLERIAYVIAEAGIKILLTHNYKHESSLNQWAGHIIRLERLKNEEKKNKPPLVKVTPGHPAYVIYTSGTTGQPKGVMVEHEALVNRLEWMQNMYPHGEEDTVLQKTAITFDVSLAELFGWFMKGSRIYFLAEGVERDVRGILDTIEKHKITSTSFTPTMLRVFLSSLHQNNVTRLSSLKWIFVAGEQLPLETLERYKRLGITARLENLYGPTEGVVYASYYTCHPRTGVEPGRIPIGKPLGKTRLYILDRNKQPVSIGKVGELYIGGMSLARGYLNRPGLTRERFCADGFFPGGKMYRTGDYARYLPDGNIVFLGRIDSQVKIKGIRIEFAEIESALMKHPGIREACVVDRDDPQGIKYLAAYIVSDKDLTVNELREYLLRKIPGNIVPAAFFKVGHMPLNPSGKTDRRKLLEMGRRIKIANEYREPRNSIEKKLAITWSAVLKCEPIGINDHFFELGGDSLKANLVLARVNREFNTQIQVKKMFDAPTIETFARVVSSSGEIAFKPIKPVEKKTHYQASAPQKRQFILNRLDKNDTGYNVNGIMILEGKLDKKRFKKTFKKIIQRHETLRTHFEMVKGEIVQRVNETVDFDVEDFEIKNEIGEPEIKKILQGEIPLAKIKESPVKQSLATIKLEKKARRTEEY